MMRSMYSGVAGLKVHQTKMDVIGNNIANVNTIGFKSQKVSFSDLFYQTSQIASGPNEEGTKGGSNARQVGLLMEQADDGWLARKKLKDIGCDIEEWYREEGGKTDA